MSQATCRRSHSSCHTLPPLIHCWSLLGPNLTPETQLQAEWMSPLAYPTLLSTMPRRLCQSWCPGGSRARAHLAVLHVLVGSIFEQGQGGLHIVDGRCPMQGWFPWGERGEVRVWTRLICWPPLAGGQEVSRIGPSGGAVGWREMPAMGIWAPVFGSICVQTCGMTPSVQGRHSMCEQIYRYN